MVTKTPKPAKLETWTVDKSIHEVVYLHFWRRYVTWFGADAPKTCDSEVYYVILITYARVLRH